MGHDTYEVKQSPSYSTLKGSEPGLVFEIYLFLWHIYVATVTYLKLKHIFGVIERSFWVSIHTLNIWGCRYYSTTDYMTARDITVSIFSWLKYARIFGGNLGHDTFGGKIKPSIQLFPVGLTQVWPLKFMLVFVFNETFQCLW